MSRPDIDPEHLSVPLEENVLTLPGVKPGITLKKIHILKVL